MAGIDLPKIPQDFENLLSGIFEETLGREISSFSDSLKQKYEREWTQKLQTAVPGDDFLMFTVTRTDLAAPQPTVTLLFRVSDASWDKLPVLKLALARAEFRIEPWVNLTDGSKPIVGFHGITSFAIEIDIKTDNYQVGLGYSQDDNPETKSKLILVAVKWKSPGFYLLGILGESEKGGLLIDVMADFPFAIPLGPTGLGLCGIGLLYGERFAPLLPGATPQTAIQRMANAEAVEYANWAAAGKTLETWVAVPDDLKLFGLSVTIVDELSSGHVIRAEQAGIAFISFGPTIVLKGDLSIIDVFGPIELVGAIDLRSMSIFGRASTHFEELGGALKFAVSIELSAAFHDQNHTYVAFGGYNMNGCSLVIFDVLQLTGGARFVPLQGAAARAAAQLKGGGTLCGFGGGYSLAVDLAAEVGWNPFGLGGHIGMSGSAWIEVFDQKLGVGVGVISDFQISEPKIFTLDLVFTLQLCWPLDDLHFPVEVFAWKNQRPAAPLAPLKFGPKDPLSWYHGPSGNTGALTANDTKLWPDVAISIDFQRQAGQSKIVVNPSNGAHDEANVKVTHDFTTLKIEKLDSAGTYVPLNDVRAGWLVSANGKVGEVTNRLAIPCIDPLGWLNKFDYAQPTTIEQTNRPRFQTFGAGPAQLFDVAAGGGNAKASFEEVDISSPRPFWLIPLPWSGSYDRALMAQRLAISFSTKLLGGNIPLATNACELRLLGTTGSAPQVQIVNGTASAPRLVRLIGLHLAEWSISIVRTEAESGNDLVLNSERTFQFVAIGYSVRQEITSPVPDVTVLRPGFYLLTIHGVSQASYRGNAAAKAPTWDVVQEFEVVPPPTRPYIRYSTLGDERIFDVEYGGWNPNPRGSGFGHYQDHVGLIRARVAYLSKIYPHLWMAPREKDGPVKVDIRPATEGTAAGTPASQEWRAAVGLPVAIEEELIFDIPKDVGKHRLLVFRSLLDDGTDAEVTDEWDYRVSKYANPVVHLTPHLNGFSRVYGPFGSRPVPFVAPPPLAAGFDFDAVPEAKLRSVWALPNFLSDFAKISDPQVGLCFLRVLDWCGVFDADRDPADEAIMLRPDNPDLCAIFDSGKAPLALLLRTSEPVDWRRIEVTLVVGSFDLKGERLETKLIPSPDGCACLVIAMAEDVPVRLPRSAVAARVRFYLQAPNLPRLTVAADVGRKLDEFSFVFDQPFGDAW